MSNISNELFHQVFGDGDRREKVTAAGTTYVDQAGCRVLLALCRSIRAQRVVEIGVQRGETARMLLANCPWIEHYIGIDVLPGTTPTMADQKSEVPGKGKAGECAKDDPRFELIQRKTGSAELAPADVLLWARSPELASPDLGNVDLVFIDGDHSPGAVARDTILARAIVRPGGVIIWHDYGARAGAISSIIDALNIYEGGHICLIEGTCCVFEIRREMGPAPPPHPLPAERAKSAAKPAKSANKGGKKNA